MQLGNLRILASPTPDLNCPLLSSFHAGSSSPANLLLCYSSHRRDARTECTGHLEYPLLHSSWFSWRSPFCIDMRNQPQNASSVPSEFGSQQSDLPLFRITTGIPAAKNAK